jgi:hypothetical protein
LLQSNDTAEIDNATRQLVQMFNESSGK